MDLNSSGKDTSGGGGGIGGGFSLSNASLFGSGVSDVFSGFGSDYKAQGNEIEAAMYGRASKFATTEARISESSTNIRESQQQRQAYQGLGDVQANVAAAGFNESGSALDILRSSTQQAALQEAVVKQQGLVTTQGYEEQAANYTSMQKAAQLAADAQRSGGLVSKIVGVAKIGAALAL